MYILYAVPVAVVLASLVTTVRRERRDARESTDNS
jgi:cytochrome c-type biogenesis protein CcmH/NrfF